MLRTAIYTGRNQRIYREFDRFGKHGTTTLCTGWTAKLFCAASETRPTFDTRHRRRFKKQFSVWPLTAHGRVYAQFIYDIIIIRGGIAREQRYPKVVSYI